LDFKDAYHRVYYYAGARKPPLLEQKAVFCRNYNSIITSKIITAYHLPNG